MPDSVIALCWSATGLFWVTVTSDLSIALAYFAIPLTMAIVFRERKDDIPYPWLWVLFVLFIVACGMTHTIHILSAVSGTEYLRAQALFGLVCALTSVGTAIAFAIVLPQIKLLPSPRQQRKILETMVKERTAEKDQLIREINHRVGNQIQVISSIVSIETRNAEGEEALTVLSRIKAELDKMAHEHKERSKVDYLACGVQNFEGETGQVNSEGSSMQATPMKAQRV